MKLILDVNPSKFSHDLHTLINEPRRSLSVVLQDLVIKGIKDNLQPLITEGGITSVKENGFYAGSCKSLKEIKDKKGYVFEHFRIKIETLPSIIIKENDIVLPIYLNWLPKDGYDSHIFMFKHVPLKKRNRYFIVIYNLFIPIVLFKSVLDRLPTPCTCPQEFLFPVQAKVWTWWIEFGCKLCGTTYFCECFRKSIDKFRKSVDKYKSVALKQQGSYSDTRWPFDFLIACERSTFRPNICHLCTDTKSDMMFCHPMYGSTVMVHYGAYIKKTAIEEDIDEREAENKIRDKLGIPRIGEGWINETQLFKTICYLFPSFSIIREASPEWLGKQRLDIYIPDLKVAIEYQGQQHYEPVDIFGGKEALKKTKEMDKRKKTLGVKNGLDIIYFRYDENLSVEFVEKRLAKYIKKA